MSIKSLSVFMNGYLDPAQVALGRLVLDMKNPGHNYCPTSALELNQNDVSKAEFLDLKSLTSAESSSAFKAAFLKLLQIFADRSRTTVDDISTKTAIRHQLLNLNIKFESILEDENVKKWLEKVVSAGQDVYMVVGLHTLQDASIGSSRDASAEVGGILQPPTDIPMAAGPSISPEVKDVLDIKLDGGHKSKSSLGVSFVAPGERVIAVQYQKIAFKMFSSKGSKSLNDARLRGKTVWRSFGAARSGTDLDTIEALLAEKTTTEDIADEEDFEAISVADNEVYVIWVNDEGELCM